MQLYRLAFRFERVVVYTKTLIWPFFFAYKVPRLRHAKQLDSGRSPVIHRKIKRKFRARCCSFSTLSIRYSWLGSQAILAVRMVMCVFRRLPCAANHLLAALVSARMRHHTVLVARHWLKWLEYRQYCAILFSNQIDPL